MILLRTGFRHGLGRLALVLAGLYALDRFWKLVALVHFFGRTPPPAPHPWPSVTLIQPVTRSAHDLRRTLASRPHLDYPGPVQHVVVYDAADAATLVLCDTLFAQAPDVTLIPAAPDGGSLASKVAKLQAALPHARGQVLCFVDDDIALRPDALQILVRYLGAPDAGATFGLACYTNWDTPWSSLMSGFVNANALLGYVPLAAITEPFTITGHCFALPRDLFAAIGGFDGMVNRIDDDHELARRVRAAGKRNVQTPLIYDVENVLTPTAYAVQVKRWSVIPRQAMVPQLTTQQQVALSLGSAGNLLPSLIGLLALFSRTRAAGRALAATLAIFAAIYVWCERRYTGRTTPLHRWPLLLVVALVTPLHFLAALNSDDVIEWRGQRLRLRRDGSFEVL